MKEEKNYHVLIVEDEPLECIVLEKILRENYSQIKRIDIAQNGIDALKMAQEYDPDLLLVDINIPVISGLELIKELYRHQFGGEILMVTAYDSFQYAKEAMKYGASGYLLKPISDQELHEYIDQCIRKIEKKRKQIRLEEQLSQGIDSLCSYAQSYLLCDLLQGNIPEDALSYAYGYPENGELQMRMIKIQFFQNLDVEYQNELLRMMEELFCPIFRMLSLVEKKENYFLIQPIEKQQKEYLNVSTWALGISAMKQIYKQFPDTLISFTGLCNSYEELQKEIERWIHQKNKKTKELLYGYTFHEFIEYCPVIQSTLFTAHEKKMKRQKAVQRMREKNGSRIVRIYKSYFENNESPYEAVYLLMRAVLIYNEEIDLSDLVMTINPNEIEKSLETWFLDQFQQNNLEVLQEKKSPVIQTALQIMREEYGSANLSQLELSERLGLSQAYFCRLFKKETGKNFVSAITEIRMCHAQELLDAGKSPEETAVECGYLNKKYFYDSFKQRFGVTVLQYQKKKER